MQRTIIVKTQFEACHRWPDAPDEVAFLRNLHRHMFFVEAELAVSHNDRELEFFIVKDRIRNFLTALMLEYANAGNDTFSCEDIAEAVLSEIEAKSVTVYEDNENGARVAK